MKTLTPEAVARRIYDDGEVLVVYDGRVLKLDSWLSRHPGGDKAILHMCGRDATAEIDAYHAPETRARMKAFAVGRIDNALAHGLWKNLTPPIQLRDGQSGRRRSDEYVDEGVDMHSAPSSSAGTPSDTDEDATPSLQGRRPAARRLGTADSGIAEGKPVPEHYRFVDEHEQREIDRDLAAYPSLDVATQAGIREKYLALGARLEREGYYDCRYSDYAWEASRWLLLASLSYACYHARWYTLSAIFLGLFWHQVTFFGHDAGHTGITHSHTLDAVLGVTVASFVGGLSIGWWKRNHNVHHLTTNSAADDPDIQHMPIFAVTPKLLTSLRSTYYDKILPYDLAASILVKLQKWTFYPIMLFGRFNLYRLSVDHILFDRGPKTAQGRLLRLYEVCGMACFVYWYLFRVVLPLETSTAGKVWFVLLSHWCTSPLHVQITLSHFAMSTSDLGPQESFAQRQLRTTMDVRCPAWLDFIHGGLQFQAIHHLFPRLPRHRLRDAQPLVRAFCQDTGIPYSEFGFLQGNEVVLGRLQTVSAVAAQMAACLEQMRQKGDYGMNLAE